MILGGALSHARGAFSSWWSTLTTVQPMMENADQSKSYGPQPSQQETVPEILSENQCSNINEKTIIEN